MVDSSRSGHKSIYHIDVSSWERAVRKLHKAQEIPEGNGIKISPR